MRGQGAVIGLLIAAIFVGSIDVAMRAYSAIGTQPKAEKVVSVKIQDRLIAAVANSQEAIQRSTSPGAVKPPKPLTRRRPIQEVMSRGCSASTTSAQRTVLLQPLRRALNLRRIGI